MMRVLIVDDEEPMRHMMRRWVEADGASVIEAGDADEALQLIEGEGPPAVALCDVWMPGRDGVWLANKLHTEYPETAVVMTTGSHDFDVAVLSLQAGVVDYLPKPFVRERLSDALKHAFAAHTSRRAQVALQQEPEARNRRVADALTDVEMGSSATVDALLAILAVRDPTARARARRVADLSVNLALALDIKEPRVSEIEHAALLHDCGALAIPEDLLGRIARATMGEDGRDAIGAHIIAVATAYDSICWVGQSPALAAGEVVDALVATNPEFDPRVLAALQRFQGAAPAERMPPELSRIA